MRKYEKPVMQVERYAAKNAVATGCYEDTITAFPSQTVSCIINGSENIFDQQQSGSTCLNDVDGAGYLGIYDGKYYFVWYNGVTSYSSSSSKTKSSWGGPGGQGEDHGPDTTLLTAVENAIHPAAVGQSGWHVGEVTYSQYKAMNATS